MSIKDGANYAPESAAQPVVDRELVAMLVTNDPDLHVLAIDGKHVGDEGYPLR